MDAQTGGRRLVSLGIGLGLIAAVALTSGSAGPASAGSAGTKLFKSGPLRYVVDSDRQGPGSLDLGNDCPVGTRLTGGGGALGTAGNGARIAGLIPLDRGDDDGFPDDGFEFRGHRSALIGAISVKSVVICLKRGQGGLAYAEKADTVSGGTLTAANTLACPAGARLVGTGLASDAATGLIRVRGLGANLQGGEINPFELIWQIYKQGPAQEITSHALCIEPGAFKVRYAEKRAQVPDGETRVLKADCPGKSRVAGGGYGLAASNALASQPFDDGDRNKAPDDGWKAKLVNSFDPSAYYVQAFCLR